MAALLQVCSVQREWIPGAGTWHSAARVSICCLLEMHVNVLQTSWNVSASDRGAKTRVLGKTLSHRQFQMAPQKVDRNARIQSSKSVSKCF